MITPGRCRRLARAALNELSPGCVHSPFDIRSGLTPARTTRRFFPRQSRYDGMAGTPRPTDAELEILTVLWTQGPSTVRAVHEALEGSSTEPEARRYTTILKLMQVMAAKGLVTRDESGRAHVYEAVISEDSTLLRLVEELARKAFGGSTLKLAVQALSSRPASPEEIEQVRRMLRELEENT